MNRIKCLRKSLRLSQCDFAKIFNVDQTAVSNWENDKNNIDIKILESVAYYFNVPIEFVLGNQFSIRIPKSSWVEDELEEYEIAKKKGYGDLVLFKTGIGYFPNSEPQKEKPADEGELSEFEKTLLVMFRQIPEEQQKAFLEMGRLFSNSHKKD